MRDSGHRSSLMLPPILSPQPQQQPQPPLMAANSLSPESNNKLRINRTDYEIAKDELNRFYQFKNKKLYQEYLIYHLNAKPYSSIIFFVFLLGLIFLPASALNLVLFPQLNPSRNSYIVFEALLLLSEMVAVFLGCLYSAERMFPKWRVYKRCSRLFLRCRRRYASIYPRKSPMKNTTSILTNNSISSNEIYSVTGSDNEDANEDDEDDTISIYYSGNNSYQNENIHPKKNIYGSLSTRVVILQHLFIISFMLFNIFYYVHNAAQENCTDYSDRTLNAILRNCNRFMTGDVNTNNIGHKVDAYPLLFMLTPVLISSVFRETLFELQIMNHCIVIIIALIVTILWNYNSINIGALIVWFFGGWSIIVDLHIHNVASFLTSHQLRETLLEKERNADRVAATEMRHMIGNVAHDLKTPLASFTTGLEIIADIIETNEKTIQLLFNDGFARPNRTSVSSSTTMPIEATSPNHDLNTVSNLDSNSLVLPYSQTSVNPPLDPVAAASVHSLMENNQGIKQCLQNIRDTNTFMLMTINRCIDYTKASRGFKLVPKYETLDLQETLRLPLDCMKNIQERIHIALKPLEMPEICSHIITDKQWLQENILCLLSNAVKYSTGGEVTIAVYLTKIEKPELTTSTNVPSDRDNSLLAAGVSDRLMRSSLADRWRNQISQTFSNFRFSTKSASKPINQKSKDCELDCEEPSGPAPLLSSAANSFNSIQSLPKLKTALSFITRQKSQLFNIEEGNEKSTTKRLDSRQGETKKEETTEQSPRKFTNNNKSPVTHHIRFDVEDTGIGMSAEAMGQLFSPFKQAQRLAGGTGLGLYSLAKRVEALNGSYGVMKRSDGNQGSLFWFSIPYRPDYTTADLYSNVEKETEFLSEKEEQRSEQGFPNESFRHDRCSSKGVQCKRRNSLEFGIYELKIPKLQILLVDDSPSIVKMSSMMLKRQGHVIEIADNGENALKRIQHQWTSNQRGFDIILMDLQMPVMDGLEATRRLRNLEKESPSWLQPMATTSTNCSPRNKLAQVYEVWSRSYPSHHYHHAVIGVSANSDDETAREAIKAGVDAFLPKPFSMDLFNTTVIKVLSKIYESYEN